ncbi:MAG: sigma-70 family RNA polymerase sigma factor [Nitrospinaceae bacterium]|nr:sigma-70 family RNA polymerase sigma factor [Nitrospinaceae bacterium]
MDKSDNGDVISTKMEEALGKLSLDDREIIVLRFFSDLSIKEISETLGIKLTATKMRRYRALEKLKEELKQLNFHISPNPMILGLKP